MKRLALALLLTPALASADPIPGTRVVALIQVAMAAAGQAPAAMATPLRPLPDCAHDPVVAPFQGSWSAVELTCGAPQPWRRVLRTGSTGQDAQVPDRGTAQHAVADTGLHPVVVALRPLRRGQRLAAGDLATAVASGADPALVLHDARLAVGRRLRAAVGQGQPVLERHLEPALSVEPGQRVTILARHGPVSVASEGQAVGGGVVGDVIRVQVAAGGREIEAEVTGPRFVQVSPKIR